MADQPVRRTVDHRPHAIAAQLPVPHVSRDLPPRFDPRERSLTDVTHDLRVRGDFRMGLEVIEPEHPKMETIGE